MSSAGANTVEQLKAAANDLYLKGDYEAAHLTYSQAIEEDPTNPILFANRAQTDLAMKKFVVLFCNVLSFRHISRFLKIL